MIQIEYFIRKFIGGRFTLVSLRQPQMTQNVSFFYLSELVFMVIPL